MSEQNQEGVPTVRCETATGEKIETPATRATEKIVAVLRAAALSGKPINVRELTTAVYAIVNQATIEARQPQIRGFSVEELSKVLMPEVAKLQIPPETVQAYIAPQNDEGGGP